METISLNLFQGLYLEFLSNFPPAVQPIISIGLAALLVYAVIQVIRKDFIYLIVLIVLLPASVPVLRNIGETIVSVIKFLIPG